MTSGIYDEPIRTENAVHALEHGAVWITYQPTLANNQVALLRELVQQALDERNEPMVILSPLPDQDTPIMATAWQVQLSIDDANDDRLAQFLDRYQVGPLPPEPGAPCTNGVGKPLS